MRPPGQRNRASQMGRQALSPGRVSTVRVGLRVVTPSQAEAEAEAPQAAAAVSESAPGCQDY